MWKLDFIDNNLLMELPVEETEKFFVSVFFKLKLRRYVYKILPGVVLFKPDLTYLDYKKIINLYQDEALKRGIDIYITNELNNYIEKKELHLDIRKRLGIELKKHDKKFNNIFENYEFIVNKIMKRKLRLQQLWDSFFMCTMQKSANFSVPGSGKTASVLGMYAYLREINKVERVIVLCPKNAFGSWIDEFKFCFEGVYVLNVFNIHSSKYKNLKQRRSALQYDTGNCNLILINYEILGNVEDILLELISEKTIIVFDEVHKVKRINGKYAKNAVNLACEANYVVVMTGTPIPNSYLDIYNLLLILFPNEYKDFFNFSFPMLRNPSNNDMCNINNKIQPFFCRTTKKELGVPKANADIIYNVLANDNENKLLHILRMKYRNNKLVLLLRILQMESNPKLLLKALDLNEFKYLLDDTMEANKIDYVDYSDEVKTLINDFGQTSKFINCINNIIELVRKQKPVIIWCMFVDSIKSLALDLDKHGITCKMIFGEVKLEDRDKILKDFKSGIIQVLITNPHTLAESISLHTICHDAIYFEYSYNLVHLLQSKDRIHRLGLPNGQYTQYYYLQQFYDTENGKWSAEQEVYNRLKEKEKIMLNAIDNDLLEILPTSEEDLNIIFSKLFKN